MAQVADKPKAEMPKPEAKDGVRPDEKNDLRSFPLPEVGKKLESSPDGLS